MAPDVAGDFLNPKNITKNLKKIHVNFIEILLKYIKTAKIRGKIRSKGWLKEVKNCL